MPQINRFAVCLVLGAVFGATTAFVDNVVVMVGQVGLARADRTGWARAADIASLVLDSGWAWAAVGVGVGWLASARARPATGAIGGALASTAALAASTLAFYTVETLLKGPERWDATALSYWLGASVILGLPLGAIGATTRRPGLVGALAGLAVPGGAAAQMVLLPPDSMSPAAVWIQAAVWLTAALGAALVIARFIRQQRAGIPDRSAAGEAG